MARNDRRALMSMATVRRSRSRIENVRLQNISAGGLCATGCMEIQTGEVLRIELDGLGLISGKVAWVEGGYFGVHFEREIDPEQIHLSAPIGRKTAEHHNHGQWKRRANAQGKRKSASA